MGEREGIKGGEGKEEGGGNQWLRYINTMVTILYGQSGTCTEVVTVINKMLASLIMLISQARPLTFHKGDRLQQGMVTPISAILKAATGVTTKSPGHGGFFSSVTESRRFSRRLKTVTGSKASCFKRNARDPFYFIMILFTLWSQGHMQF